MGLAQCSWPVWQVDDFTSCFQKDYLKVVCPIIVVALSIARLVQRNILRVLEHLSANRYSKVATTDHAADHTALPPEGDESEDDDLEINGGRLALVKTTTKGSIVQADAPPGQLLSQTVEILAITGLVAVNLFALVTQAYGADGQAAAGVGLATWIYVLLLATLRIFFGRSRKRIASLWNHTAFIYGWSWLFVLFIFRSVLIHPSSRAAQILIIVEFVLVSLLFLMAVTTRRGNKTVLLEWENGIEPSREPLASLFSLATFSWVDAIVWKGWKQPMELDHVWNLLPSDKAAVVIADYRQLKRTTALTVHLLKYFKRMVLTQCLLACASGFFTFAPTLLLKAILEYVEQPDQAPRNVLWLYVIAMPILDMVRSYADGMALWIGRKVCIQVRAIIIGDIYAKALRRKAAAGKDKVLLGEEKPAAEPQSPDQDAGKGFAERLKRSLGLKKKETSTADDAEAADGLGVTNGPGSPATPAPAIVSGYGDDEQANLGTIINLMSVDSFKVSEVTAYLHFLCAAAPTQLIVCIALLWQVMGLSAIPGIIIMILLLPVNYLVGMGFNSTSKAILAATDKRINVTNEVLSSIRVIKYFAWEHRFGRIISEKRQAELKALRARFMVWAIAVAIWNSVPPLITFFSFLVYTVIEGKPLYPSVAFTAMSLFMLLRVPLDQFGDMFAHVQEAKVSIDRVEEFLNEDETEKYEQLGEDNVDEDGIKRIGFKDTTLIWGSKSGVEDEESSAFSLLEMNVDFQIGKLNIIAGPTGSGKTSMLMGLLGEMTLVRGRVFCPGGRSREDVRPDLETGLADTIAYVAQSAWLINANIRDNILFSAPYDPQRYRNVIIACGLERDLEILDHGDETLVGDKGISLSGGQKQRISLARAVYSNSAHLLLDDCLSAVDSHTAQWIFSNCIKGPLMSGRTCILVTHNVQLCVPASDYVVVLENGRIATQGPAQEVIASGQLGDDVQRSRPGSVSNSRIPSRVPSSVGEPAEAVANGNGTGAGLDGATDSKKTSKKKDAKPQQDAMDEGKATGAVKWPVMKLYLLSMGSWWFWVVAIMAFSLQQLSAVATNLWVKEWANQYVPQEIERVEHVAVSSLTRSYGAESFSRVAWANMAKFGGTVSGHLGSQAATVDGQTPLIMAGSKPDVANVNVAFYLSIFALIGIAGALAAFVRDLWVFFGSLKASKRLHERLITSVSRARFLFFDVTPLGQLMNRFSKDLEAVDQEVAPTAIGVLSCAFSLVVTVVLIAAITPGFLIAAVFIFALFYMVAIFYLRSSRDLKRLESVQRSPLFQQFGETLSGMTTIRAYGDERRFIRDNLIKVNTQSRPFIYLWACNRWLAFRADGLGNLVTFFAGVFIILSVGNIDAGAAGISLSYAMSFTENVLWLVRQYAVNEQNMNSMERVKEYLEVEQEADAVVEDNRPPSEWPQKGAVEFVNYSTRYRAELEPVLRNISLKINAKEKVGIVGRTGAGKSSLALALFRALEADKGKIVLDGIDIGSIGLQDLRERITIVPQDPTLFMGTIRTNLDPFEQYTDDEIFDALRRVQLIGPDEPSTVPPTPRTPKTPKTPRTPALFLTHVSPGMGSPALSAVFNKNVFLDLSSPVSESGSNLSQGQRQLLCLARAMLKEPKVLVMDEATASIDYYTDSKIQEAIRELTGTVVTIAHRLQTIVDYDKVLALDQGSVIEYGHPWELLQKEKGLFKGMCESSGELDLLSKAAKKKWDADRLVDVDP